MRSKLLYNLFLIFFLAAVTLIYFDRAFMILCAHRAQLFSKIRLFLRNYLFRMRMFEAGPGGWVGALWEGWQVCGARFPFFCGAMGTPQLPAFNLSCVNCNPSRAILCGIYLIIIGVLPCVNLQLIYLKQL